MAEMPDVVTLTTISTDWGNDIRDRTVQRYASVAARTAAHSAPAEGDLSYLTDSNTVWVYTGAAWVNIAQAVGTADITDDAVTNAKLAPDAVGTTELAANAVTSAKIADGTIVAGDLAAAAVAGFITFAQDTNITSLALTGSFQPVASTSINLTALGWGGASILAWGSASAESDGVFGMSVQVSIDGNVGAIPPMSPTEGNGVTLGAAHNATALTAGTKTVLIQARKDSGVFAVDKTSAWICVLAVRQ